MKRAILTRGPSTDQGTFGSIALANGPTLRTVELPWRDNASGISCIPPGVYRCVPFKSPKHGDVYLLQGVPGRDMIEIHIANFAGDAAKGWTAELLGCIAPALRIAPLKNKASPPVDQMAGISSRIAFQEFMAWARGEVFELEIR